MSITAWQTLCMIAELCVDNNAKEPTPSDTLLSQASRIGTRYCTFVTQQYCRPRASLT
jgi:hypothetical protein